MISMRPAVLLAIFTALICINVSRGNPVEFENLDRMAPVKRLFTNIYGKRFDEKPEPAVEFENLNRMAPVKRLFTNMYGKSGKRFEVKPEPAMGMSPPDDYEMQLRRASPLDGIHIQSDIGYRSDNTIEDATMGCRVKLERAYNHMMERCVNHY